MVEDGCSLWPHFHSRNNYFMFDKAQSPTKQIYVYFKDSRLLNKENCNFSTKKSLSHPLESL